MKTYAKLFLLGSASAMVGGATSRPCKTAKCRAKVVREDLRSFRTGFRRFKLAIADIDDFVTKEYQPLMCDELERCSDAEGVVSAWKQDLDQLQQDIGNVEETEDRLDQELEILAETNDTDNGNHGRLRHRQLQVSSSMVDILGLMLAVNEKLSNMSSRDSIMREREEQAKSLAAAAEAIRNKAQETFITQAIVLIAAAALGLISAGKGNEISASKIEEDLANEWKANIEEEQDWIESELDWIDSVSGRQIVEDLVIEWKANKGHEQDWIKSKQDWIDSETFALEDEMESLNSLMNKINQASDLLIKAMDSFQVATDNFAI